jgi:hypothetical protein
MVSKAAVVSRSPASQASQASKTNSQAKSPIRAGSKAVNRADSRTSNQKSGPLTYPPARMLGDFFRIRLISVDPAACSAGSSRQQVGALAFRHGRRR